MDILQREGNYPVPPGATDILGVEFSGHVTALGPDTSLWQTGDEVLGLSSGVSRILRVNSIRKDPIFSAHISPWMLYL